MSEDMYREMLREKWEAEQRELLDKQETVHYANVRFDGMDKFNSKDSFANYSSFVSKHKIQESPPT